MEVGRRKSEDRRRKLEVGRRKLEVGSWKWEVGRWKMEVGSWKWEDGRRAEGIPTGEVRSRKTPACRQVGKLEIGNTVCLTCNLQPATSLPDL